MNSTSAADMSIHAVLPVSTAGTVASFSSGTEPVRAP